MEESGRGLGENMGKRQKWTRAGKERVEHLGITAPPADPSQPVVLRDGWKKLKHTINCIGGLPGTADVRQRLTVGFARHLWFWAVASH